MKPRPSPAPTGVDPMANLTKEHAGSDTGLDADPRDLRRGGRQIGWVGRWSESPPGYLSIMTTFSLVALIIVIWHLGSQQDWWSPLILPPPNEVAAQFDDLARSTEFRGDLRTTCFEIAACIVLGVLIGVVSGILFWLIPLLGRALEPFIVSFYAVPLMVVYPVMIVVIGMTPWSVIVLGTVDVAIAVTLNVWLGLRETPAGHLRLAVSLGCSTRQVLTYIAGPSAIKQVMAGVRIGSSIAVAAVVGMEFLMASDGMGFRVRYLYEDFQTARMLAYVAVLFVLAILVMETIRVAERIVLRRHHDD